jgi:hypothetical protein
VDECRKILISKKMEERCIDIGVWIDRYGGIDEEDDMQIVFAVFMG